MDNKFFEKLLTNVGHGILVSRGFRNFTKVKLLWVEKFAGNDITISIKNPKSGKVRIISHLTPDEVKFQISKVRKRSKKIAGNRRLIIYTAGNKVKITIISKNGSEKTIFEDDGWFRRLYDEDQEN